MTQSQLVCFCSLSNGAIRIENISFKIALADCPITPLVLRLLFPRRPTQVLENVIQGVAIDMVDRVLRTWRRPKKRVSHDNVDEDLFSVLVDTKVDLVSPMQNPPFCAPPFAALDATNVADPYTFNKLPIQLRILPDFA